jgi:molybdate transport system substrate-binding protein
MKTKLFIVSLFILISIIDLPVFAQNSDITIAVAANVQYAMKDLKAEFEKESGIKTNVIIGSSGQLTAQIQQGAPYDVFISADMKYPKVLFNNGKAVEFPKVYAYGSLVIWTLKKGISFEDDYRELLKRDIQKIALANPRTAPYGVATIEALKYFKIYNQVRDKLVYGESISPTNQYIVSKAADVGFTAKSVVLSPAMLGKGAWKEIPPEAYQPIKQGCVILSYGFNHHLKEAQLFYNFLFSGEAMKILEKYGYKIPDGREPGKLGENRYKE